MPKMQFSNDLSRAVRVNLTPEDYERVSKCATANRISVSAVLRLSVLDYLEQFEKPGA